jgi:hypothetical protein
MLSGLPIIYGINPYESEATPSHSLGTIGYDSDGRKFRYCKNNATNAMVAGYLQQAPVEDTGDQDLAIAASASIGDKTVSLAAATVTANQYADGYLAITVTPGEGLYYKIKSHPAATAATVVITLYEPLKVALTTASNADLVANPYNGVLINPTTATSAPVGVAMTAVPASYYSWIQVGGPGMVVADASGAVTVGASVTASNQTAGCVEDGDTDTQAIVGVALTGIAQGEPGMAMLTID